MKADDPRHGTYAGYVAHHKASCDPCPACALAGRRFQKAARMDLERGRPRTVALGITARRALDTMPATHLAEAAGIAVNTVHRLRREGPDQPVLRRVRDAILKAHGPTPVGVQRRLRALHAMGYSMRALGHEMGQTHADNLLALMRRHEVNYVRRDMAEPVVAAYERLHMIPAPDGAGSSRARNRALREGWLPPMAWDDIDNPDEKPATGGPSARFPSLVEDFDWLVSQGESEAAAAARLGIKRMDSFIDQRRRMERQAS